MSRLESAETIEAKVAALRHATEHLGRAVSVTERVYVLHSEACTASGIDLRECEYSTALDLGIDLGVWENHLDVPVVLGIDPDHADLVPVRNIAPRRVIVIASTLEEGRTWSAPIASQVVAIITPRSPYGARGRTADELCVSPAMHDHPRRSLLEAEAAPAMATVRRLE